MMKTLEIKTKKLAERLNSSIIDFEYSRDKGDAEAALEIINNHIFTADELEGVVEYVEREAEGDERVAVDVACQDLIDKRWNLERVTFFIQ